MCENAVFVAVFLARVLEFAVEKKHRIRDIGCKLETLRKLTENSCNGLDRFLSFYLFFHSYRKLKKSFGCLFYTVTQSQHIRKAVKLFIKKHFQID
jgi:hypothetical protein